MTETGRSAVSAMLVAQVERELAELQARDRAGVLAPSAGRRGTGASTVFSVRLDPDELTALENRAAARGIPTSTLARNLIRVGLKFAYDTDHLGTAVHRVEEAVAELRAALP
jgi:hypothetical protein